MRHAWIGLLGLLVLAAVFGPTAGLPTTARVRTPAPTSGHPLVGAWVVDWDEWETGDAQIPRQLVVFTSDGSFIGARPDGGDFVGAWAPNGPRDALVMRREFAVGEDPGTAGTGWVYGGVEVAADGQTFVAADYGFGDEQGWVGSFRSLWARGTRIVAEWPDTPELPGRGRNRDRAATPVP